MHFREIKVKKGIFGVLKEDYDMRVALYVVGIQEGRNILM